MSDSESESRVISVEKMDNKSIRISFDSGSSVGAYWLSEEEAMQLVDDLMLSIHPK